MTQGIQALLRLLPYIIKKNSYDMRITLDKVADAMYIELNNGKVASTEENGDYLIDYDSTGKTVGIEILFVSEKVELLKNEARLSG